MGLLSETNEKILITVDKDGKQTTTESQICGEKRIVIIINNQFTNAPNTTQIASGAGRNSAAGNNAAIDSSNTEQQQSVGAQGKAQNLGMKGYQAEPHDDREKILRDEAELVIIINNQINETSGESAATQVTSGAGDDSAAGTNAAIESSNTKQQHAVGGDQSGTAINRGMNSPQIEGCNSADIEDALNDNPSSVPKHKKPKPCQESTASHQTGHTQTSSHIYGKTEQY